MDWFETLTGLRDGSYEETRAQLRVEGSEQVSAINGRRLAIDKLTLPSLAELRVQVAGGAGPAGRRRAPVFMRRGAA
jgi:hypothetical protein